MLTEQQRDELLVRLDERTERADHALFGNGQPGLAKDVAVLKEDMRRREEEARELREAVPSKRKRALWDSGTLTVIMAAALMAVKTVFGL